MLFNNTSKIIKNRELLSIDYVPKKIVGRDIEIKELAFHLSYLFRENPSLPQLIVYGSVGTGKTTCINYVLNELKKISKDKAVNLKVVKIKGSESRTKYEILKKIIQTIAPEEKTINTSADIYNKIISVLSSNGVSLMIFIDEIHELKKEELNSVLYTISRLGGDVAFSDSRQKLKLVKSEKGIVGYIVVSNERNITKKLKDNTKSSLTKEVLDYKRYEPSQIINILNSRIEEGALHKGKIEEGVLELISGISVKEGQDSRYALVLLNNSAKECEKRNEEKISVKIVKSVNAILLENYMKALLRDQPNFYLDILLIIYYLYKNKKKLNGKTIWEEYKLREYLSEVNYSRISQIITSFEKDGIVYVTSSDKTKLRSLSIEENLQEIEEVLKEKGKIKNG